jgi:hypothetical protein
VSDLDIAQRIVARFKGGALVADPWGMLRKFRQALDKWDEYVSDAKRIQDIYAEYHRMEARGGIPESRNNELSAELAEIDKSLRNAKAFVTTHYVGEFRNSWNLSLTVLQKFSLPPALRKKVEAISRYWATKQKIRAPRLPRGYGRDHYDAVVTTYLKYIDLTQEQLAVLTEAMTKGRPIAEGDAEDAAKVKAGPFMLINTGGFPDDVMHSVADTVKKCAEYASTSGLGQVCYGEINVSQKIGRKNTLAFYVIAQDELFVRADAKTSTNHIHNILHELGHRYEHKFLKNKNAPARMYMLIGGRHREEIRKNAPKPGDVMVDQKTQSVYEVTGLSGTTVHLRNKVEPNVIEKVQEEAKKEILRRRPELAEPTPNNENILHFMMEAVVNQSLARLGVGQAKIDIESYYAHRGIDPRSSSDFKGFMSPYAATSQAENFAEMFAFYCTGDLPPTQAALFEEQVFNETPQRPDFSIW